MRRQADGPGDTHRMGLIPNPAGDLIERADTTISNVGPVLERVEQLPTMQRQLAAVTV